MYIANAGCSVGYAFINFVDVSLSSYETLGRHDANMGFSHWISLTSVFHQHLFPSRTDVSDSLSMPEETNDGDFHFLPPFL